MYSHVYIYIYINLFILHVLGSSGLGPPQTGKWSGVRGGRGGAVPGHPQKCIAKVLPQMKIK